MKDGEFLLRVLADGRPHSLNEILRRSFAERGCGLTVHSRAADLRRDGHNVVNWKDGIRGDGSWYMLGSPTPDYERFMKYVEERPDGCWQWTGTISGSCGGYGAFWVSGSGKSAVRAHRWLYEYLVGPIPEGLQLDHLCRNKHCVNPGHLEPVTASENKRRDYEALGTCRSGRHARNEETTMVTKEGWRICRLCFNETQRRSRAKKAGLLDEPDVSTGGVSGSSSGRPAGSAVSPLGGGAAAAAQLVLPVGTKGAYS